MSTIILLANVSSGDSSGITFNYPSLNNKATLTFSSLDTEFNLNVYPNFLATASINQDNKDTVILKLELKSDSQNVQNLEYTFSAKDHASLKIIKFQDELKQYLKDDIQDESSIPEIRQICYEIKDFITQIKSLVKLLNTNLSLDLQDKYNFISTQDFFNKSKDQIPLFALIYSKYIPKDPAVSRNKANVKDALEVGEYPQYLSVKNSWNEERLYTVHDDSINCLVMDYYELGQMQDLKFTEGLFDDLKSIYLSSIIASLAREKLSNGGVAIQDNNNNNAITQQGIINLLQDSNQKDIFLRVSPGFKNFTDQNTEDLKGKASAQGLIDTNADVTKIKNEMKSFATEATIKDIKLRLKESDSNTLNPDGLLISIQNYAKISYITDELKKYTNITELTNAKFLIQNATAISSFTRNVYIKDETFSKTETYSKIYIDNILQNITEQMLLLATQEGMDEVLKVIEEIRTNIITVEKDIENNDKRISVLEQDHVTLANFDLLKADVATNTASIVTINDSIGKLGDLDDLKKLANFFIKTDINDSNKKIIDAYTATKIDQLFYTKANFTAFEGGKFKLVDDRSIDNKNRLDALPDFSKLPNDLGDITLLVNALVIEDPINNTVKLVNTYTKPQADSKFHKISDFNDFKTTKYDPVTVTVNSNSGKIKALEDKFLKITDVDDLAKYSFLQSINIININAGNITSNVYAKSDTYSKTQADNKFTQIASFEQAKFLTTGATAINDTTRNVYTKQEIVDDFVKKIDIPDFNGITNLNELVSKSELATEKIITVSAATKVITRNVYTKSEVDTDFSKIANLTTAKFLTTGATAINDTTRNVYTKQEIVDDFVKKIDIPDFNGITNLNELAKIAELATATFLKPGSTRITDTTRNVYTIKEIDDKDFAFKSDIKLFPPMPDFTGVTDIKDLLLKAELSGVDIIKINTDKTIKTNVYTIKEVDALILANKPNIDMAAVQALIDGSLSGYITNIVFKPVSDQVILNTSAIATLQNQIATLPTTTVLNGYAKIADLTSSEFLTSGAGSLTKVTRNVYTKQEIVDDFVKKDDIPDFNGITNLNELVSKAALEVEQIITVNAATKVITRNVYTIKEIDDKDFAFKSDIKTFPPMPDFTGITDIKDLLLKAELSGVKIITVDPTTKAISTNVYTIKEIDDKGFATQSAITTAISAITPQTIDLDDYYKKAETYSQEEANNTFALKTSIPDFNGITNLNKLASKAELATEGIITVDDETKKITTNVYTKDEIDQKNLATQSAITTAIEDIQIPDVSNFITSVAFNEFLTSSLNGYATIQALNDANFLTSASLSDGARNIYTKMEVDNKITSALSGVTPAIDTTVFALKADVYLKTETYSQTEAKNTFALKGNYLTSASLNDYVKKTDVYLRGDADTTFALKSDIKPFPTLPDFNTFLTLASLNGYALKTDVYLRGEADITFALKSDIKPFPTLPDFNTFLTLASLNGYALKTDVYLRTEAESTFAKKNDVYLKTDTYNQTQIDAKIAAIKPPTIDTSSFALKTDLNSIVTEVKSFASTETKNIESLINAITALLGNTQVKNCPVIPQ